MGVWIYVLVFSSIYHHMCLYANAISYYYSSLAQLETMHGDISSNSIIVQDYFSYSGFFVFSYEVENCSFEVYNFFLINTILAGKLLHILFFSEFELFP